MVGSYVPEGVAVGTWVTQTATGVTAFYDIDTPVTLAKLRSGDHEYLSPALIPRYALYLSFTGGPILKHLERSCGAAAQRTNTAGMHRITRSIDGGSGIDEERV